MSKVTIAMSDGTDKTFEADAKVMYVRGYVDGKESPWNPNEEYKNNPFYSTGFTHGTIDSGSVTFN